MCWLQSVHTVPCITFPIAAPSQKAGCSNCGAFILHVHCEGLPTSMPELHVAGTAQEIYTETITGSKTKPLQAKPQQGFYAVT